MRPLEATPTVSTEGSVFPHPGFNDSLRSLVLVKNKSFFMAMVQNTAIRLLLLLVLASSQILSGLSCCCLGKITGGANRSTVLSHQDFAPSVQNAKNSSNKPRCPKCSSSSLSRLKAAENQPESGREVWIAQDDENPCRCIKSAYYATLDSRVFEFDSPDSTWMAQNFSCDLSIITSANVTPVLYFTGQLRRLNWQAIACIWLN